MESYRNSTSELARTERYILASYLGLIFCEYRYHLQNYDYFPALCFNFSIFELQTSRLESLRCRPLLLPQTCYSSPAAEGNTEIRIQFPFCLTHLLKANGVIEVI
jgi:hypothetical protein